MSKKTIIALIGVVLLLIGLGVGVYLVLQQQELRKNAAPATTLSISPSSKTVGVGETTDFNVQMDTQTNTLSSVDLEISFNPQVISIEGVTVGTFLPVMLSTPRIDSTVGTIRASFGASPSSPQKGIGVVATIKVKGKNAGTSALSFGSNTHAAGVSESTDVISVKTPGSITVSAAALAPAPTSTPVPTIAPTSSPKGASTATSSATASASATPTSTPIAATGSAIPVTGIEVPTYFMLFAGFAIVGIGIILAAL